MGARGSGDLLGVTLFGATRQRILALLFGHPDERFYQRRIIQAVGLGSGTVQRDLERLTAAGILTRTVEGRQTYFQANRDCPVFEELHGLVRKTFGIAEILKGALVPLAGRIRVALIFGSLAAGTGSPASDLDLLVIGDGLSLEDILPAVAGAQRELGREINPMVYPTDEFCRKLAAGQHFISRVVAGQKIFLFGDERALRGLAQIRLDQGTQIKPAGDRRPVRRG